MSIVVTLALRRLRIPLLALVGAYAISIVGLTLMPGVDDQGRPWRMDFFHAFYFVSYMASTIGFGELPYKFTAAQRMWVTGSIYLTVVAWLYTIGTLLALIQDPAFRQALTRQRFARAVRAMPGTFYLVCGYGDTGSLLVRALAERGMRASVIDASQERLNELILQDLPTYCPGLLADAEDPHALADAGLRHLCCAGVIALTSSDRVNLKVAITAKLLNPRVAVICRADSHDAEANMESFGTDHVINPFDGFADRLAMALHSPAMHLLFDWLTSIPRTRLAEPLSPPHGRWVLCGYGRLGKAVSKYLEYEGIETTIVEETPEKVDAPEDAVTGPPAEAVTLRAARVGDAVGLVAGTDDDADNLSTIITARALNPELFLIARQNRRDNELLFRAAKLDLVMQRSDIIAHRVLAYLTSPLLPDFLRLARHQREAWANELISRLSAVLGELVPRVWDVVVDDEHAPAVHTALSEGSTVRLRELLRDPRERERSLQGLALMLVRDDEPTLLPSGEIPLAPGDRLLFCGQERVAESMQWSTGSPNVLTYIQTGETRPAGAIWRWLAHRES